MTRFLALISLILFATLGLSACDSDQKDTTTEAPEIIKGAVATVHPLATQAGEAILAQGGNAIDAAVAAALTLGVVDGHNSGIGGGCFIVIRWADGRLEAIDGREMAPAEASHDMYIVNGVADSKLSTTGALAIGIPGSLAAYQYLLEEGGNHSLTNALLPAAELAEQGVTISESFASRLAHTAKGIRQFPETARILLDSTGQPLASGDLLVQPELAHTYRKLAEQGIDYFYTGPFAKAVARWMQANGGIVTAEDFANYQLKKREPVLSNYRGYQIAGFPPPSSGGVHVSQILQMLESFDVSSLSEADRQHLLAEVMKLAFADRAYWLGDPDFVNVPKGLVNPDYTKALASKVDMQRASPVLGAGTPPNADFDLFGKHTTHIATADSEGNWVAITTTVNTSFGSKVIIPGTGVIMNNQMDDFSAQPGVQNAFGLVGAEANSIAPGKRPLSSMSPTIVLKDGQPVLTVGAAGGPTIITQVVQALVNVIDLGMPLQDSLAAQRIHHQWKPNQLFIEPAMSDEVRNELTERGHLLVERRHFGATQIIGLDEEGEFVAVSEPRLKPIRD